MASHQDIKRRIRSVRNTHKITKALELVSASKLRRAQLRIEALRPYADRMRELEMEAASQADVHGQPLLARRETKVSALLVTRATRPRGRLQRAGAARGDRGRPHGAGQTARRRAGSPSASAVSARSGSAGLPLMQSWQGFTDRPGYGDAAAIAQTLLRGLPGRRGSIASRSSTTTSRERAQPDGRGRGAAADARGRLADVSPRERALEGTLLFEPKAADLLDGLLQRSIEIAIYRALLASATSEHGARMTAMGNASQNADELIGGLTLAMNRARQAEITQEILEVVAGADALT